MISDKKRYVITCGFIGFLAVIVYVNAGYAGVETMLITLMATQFIQLMEPKA